MLSIIERKRYMVNVELIYAPRELPLIHLRMLVVEGSSVGDVLRQSGLFQTHPEVCNYSIGIFSKIVDADVHVKSGDRIEIYRPLLIDPMEKRRQRAKKI
jgi:putative ubiquitin-RnfH superfamily antitoxin RatB of RatAB toxin-antitoxin module